MRPGAQHHHSAHAYLWARGLDVHPGGSAAYDLRPRQPYPRTSTGTRLKAGVPLSASITGRMSTLASG
jgi:hypothetical protein